MTSANPALVAIARPADRRRLRERMRELAEFDELMRRPGSLAEAPEPVPLHMAGRTTTTAGETARRPARPPSPTVLASSPSAGIPGQHVDREVHGDGVSAPRAERGADRPGAGAGVEHGAPGERMGAHRDQLGGDRAVDQHGASRPPQARADVAVGFHPAMLPWA